MLYISRDNNDLIIILDSMEIPKNSVRRFPFRTTMMSDKLECAMN